MAREDAGWPIVVSDCWQGRSLLLYLYMGLIEKKSDCCMGTTKAFGYDVDVPRSLRTRHI